MKRIYAVLFTLLFLFSLPSALAEAVREQVDAPDTYQAQYFTNTQKSTVIVDAQVFVPDVNAIPLWAVSARDFTAEEAWALAKAVRPNDTWLRLNGSDSSTTNLSPLPDNELDYSESGSGTSFINMHLASFPSWSGEGDYNAFHGDLYDAYYFVDLTSWYMDTALGSKQAIDRNLNFQFAAGYNEPYYYHSLSFTAAQTMGKRIDEQALNYDAAKEMAEAVISAYAPDFAWRTDGWIYGEITYHKANSKDYRNTEWKTPAYFFAFTRSIAGIPITLVTNDVLTNQMPDMPVAPAPNNETITVTVSGEQIVDVNCNNPYQIDEMLEANTTLLPFEQIMNIFGTIAPLSIQSLENENQVMGGAGNKLEITEIHLGYMPVLKKDDPNQWVLRPVWDFIGIRSFAREYYDFPCQSYLTIDAIDGTVIDRKYGY